MERYESNITADDAAQLLAQAKRVLVTCHAKPDGDAFGAVVAVSQAIEQLGNVADAVLVGPIPQEFQSLPGFEKCIDFDQFDAADDYDLVVILDTGAWSQLEPMQSMLSDRLDRCLVIDHHVTGDVPVRWRLIDTTSAATCQIVADLLQRMPQSSEDSFFATAAIRDALFTGIATDTGWFRFSNTSPQTLQWAARLIDAGVSHARIYQNIEQAARPAKLILMARALENCRLIGQDRAAIMTLSREDFISAGAGAEDTDRLVNLPLIVGKVQVVVLISDPPNRSVERPNQGQDQGQDRISVSFRSKPGSNAVDVAELARQFGGGGHQRAAGAKVAGPINEVSDQICEAVEIALSKPPKE